MKRLTLTFVFLCLLNVQTWAQEKPEHAVKSKVQREGKATESVILPRGRVKVSANCVTYDRVSDTVMLTPGCIVTVVQDNERLMHLKSDKMTVKAAEVEVQVDGTSPTKDAPGFPPFKLAEALQIDPKFTLFRVNWYYSAGSFADEGTALFDRTNHTLREYRIATTGEDSGTSHSLYSGVTEDAIHKMAESLKQNHSSPHSFDDLTKYGCRKEELR